jgi:hypothetical protein
MLQPAEQDVAVGVARQSLLVVQPTLALAFDGVCHRLVGQSGAVCAGQAAFGDDEFAAVRAERDGEFEAARRPVHSVAVLRCAK